MILISEYKAFWEYIKNITPGIDRVIMVHEDGDLAGMIKEVADDETLLIAVIPSADVESANLDDIEEIDTCFVFIVNKCDRKNLTHAEFLAGLEVTQLLMASVKGTMIDLSGDTDHCHTTPSYGHMMHRLVVNGMHTDPEYNLLECYGWGLSFRLKSKGVTNQP
jgi:hypothetical protein